MLLKEYNLNLIDLNSLIEEDISFEIYRFILTNSLNLKLNSTDSKRIFLHFILKKIINEENILYNNIYILNDLQKINYLNCYFDEKNTIDFYNKLIKLIKLNFNLNFVINKEINFSNLKNSNFNEIYKIQNLIEKENFKTKNLQKSKKFCEKNGLMEIYSVLLNNRSKIFKLSKN